ncbi:MAG: MepB family protein [Bacteroidetes bacterium]|nr:MepB family protein [Bacteroidota bacterium]
MLTKNTLNNQNLSLYNLKIINELVYNKCGFNLTNLILNKESVEYEACSFKLNEKVIQYRVSKITPTKTGQFVAIWKRNKNGLTEPFNDLDDFDFIIITSKSENNFGQFIFPKSILVEKCIITKKGKEGKRGIRVYPPWDITTNKQAIKTQNWQIKYFLDFSIKNKLDKQKLKALLNIEKQ